MIKGNFEIDDSTSALAEVNINGDIKKILNQMFEEEEEREEPEYALKICTEKKCLHLGVCTKNLCNDPENLEKMANLAEQGISGMLSMILLLVLGSRDLSQAETTSLLQAEQFTK